jgi:AcrR family transcriptional regulator
MSREKIEKTRASLSAKGERVTVDKVCEALGISPATYYRYKAA